MPGIQTSLLMAMPACVGQMLPDSCRAGVRQYIASSDPEKAVRAAPATLVGTTG